MLRYALATLVIFCAGSFSSPAFAYSINKTKSHENTSAEATSFPSARMRSYCHAMGCDYRIFYEYFEDRQDWYCKQRGPLLKKHNLRILRLVASIAERYGLHGSVAVLPIIESSLNAQSNRDKLSGAKGFWQLMPGTARDMGLVVQGGVDQRLDISKSTQAAMKYLTSLKTRYNDHNLAVMAYNAGSGRVDKLIEKHGTRNPWYLSRVMADAAPDEDYLMKYYAYTLVLLGEGCR